MNKNKGISFYIKPMPLFFMGMKLNSDYWGFKAVRKKGKGNKAYIKERKREKEKRIKKEKEREE